ncbi:hypothetical protein FGO68_gene10868 [Halteria grandinella]|uniref:Uncharacterized protein n=1 Tax=Halteria grandinella TaxID=5974 RepID=A0A8J8P0Z6_HALGN|nr:hypothetical protein FGO68_gene10868 [Halteria grandinella]
MWKGDIFSTAYRIVSIIPSYIPLTTINLLLFDTYTLMLNTSTPSAKLCIEKACNSFLPHRSQSWEIDSCHSQYWRCSLRGHQLLMHIQYPLHL